MDSISEHMAQLDPAVQGFKISAMDSGCGGRCKPAVAPNSDRGACDCKCDGCGSDGRRARSGCSVPNGKVLLCPAHRSTRPLILHLFITDPTRGAVVRDSPRVHLVTLIRTVQSRLLQYRWEEYQCSQQGGCNRLCRCEKPSKEVVRFSSTIFRLFLSFVPCITGPACGKTNDSGESSEHEAAMGPDHGRFER
jgi:hypothetical protein